MTWSEFKSAVDGKLIQAGKDDSIRINVANSAQLEVWINEDVLHLFIAGAFSGLSRSEYQRGDREE